MNPQPFLGIQIVTWNSLRFLPLCLASLKEQTYANFSVLIIDNHSTDGTVEFLKKQYPEVAFVQNSGNLGFSKAHNQGIRYYIQHQTSNTQHSCILVLNPDVILTPDYLLKLMAIMVKEQKAAAITGRLLRYEMGDGAVRYTYAIDSEGLEILKSRKAQDRNNGITLTSTNARLMLYQEVFGVSGACALYRLAALEDAKLPIRINPPNPHKSASYEYFDEDFFTYKEDVDLSWRLRLLGWKMLFTPTASAYHHRAVRKETRLNRHPLINYWSYSNHLSLLVKNDDLTNVALHFPFIIGFEFKKLSYLLFREPKTLAGLIRFCKSIPKMLRKRRLIMARRKVTPKEIRQWFR